MDDIDHLIRTLERTPVSRLRPVALPLLSAEELLRWVPQYDEAQTLHADIKGRGIAAETTEGEMTLWKVTYTAGYLFHDVKMGEHSGTRYVLEIKDGRFSQLIGSQQLATTYEILDYELGKREDSV